jgi:hypothetical protein
MGKIVDPSVHVSHSSCDVIFSQNNPQPGGTSMGVTS